MTYQAFVSFKPEGGTAWEDITAQVKHRRTHRGARADALKLFALMSPAKPQMFARIVREHAGVRKVVETLEIGG